jgi:hypothetical protein
VGGSAAGKRLFTKMRRNGPVQRVGRFALAARIHALLRLGIIASVALASSGAGYYRAIYVPERDAALAQQRVEDETRAYAQVRAAQVRHEAEQRELEQRRAAAKVAAESRYQTCLSSAGLTHDTSWAAECKRIADKVVEDRAGCLAKSNMPQGYCAAVYRIRDGSPDCTLPVAIAADLDGGLTIARNRCQREREAAVRQGQ